jgi:hypothetical protein
MADLEKCRLARRHSIILFSRETGAKVKLAIVADPCARRHFFLNSSHGPKISLDLHVT